MLRVQGNLMGENVYSAQEKKLTERFMSSYGFRIRFILHHSSTIQHETDTLAILLPPGKHAVLLQSATNQSLKESHNLIIRGSGFSCADEAFAFGRKVKNSLMVCSSLLGMSMDLGQDKATSGVGKIIKNEAKKAGFMLLNDVHGLCIYPEDIPVTFSSINGPRAKGTSTVTFIREFTRAYEHAEDITGRQSLAFELYSSSKWIPSKKARLFLLMNALESLIYPDETARETARIIQGKLGDESAQVYLSGCTARNTLMEAGDPQVNIDLINVNQKLDKLVSSLIFPTAAV
jgi:hypothetical protein